MNIKTSVPEVVELIKELQSNLTRIFEMIGINVQKNAGGSLSDEPDENEPQLNNFLKGANAEYLRIVRITYGI